MITSVCVRYNMIMPCPALPRGESIIIEENVAKTWFCRGRGGTRVPDTAVGYRIRASAGNCQSEFRL